MIAPEAGQARRKLLALVEIGAVGLLVTAHADFFREHHLAMHLLRFGADFNFGLNAGEARLYAANALVAFAGAVLLVDASLRLSAPGQSLLARAAASPRRSALLLAVFAVVATELLARLFGHAAFTDDERIYQWTARNLLAGHFTSPRPQPAEFFQFTMPFMLDTPDGRWGSMYPPGHPALLALGLLMRLPHLPLLVCVGGTVYVGARLADDLWGAEVSVLTAALLATSPMLLMIGATWHNDVSTTFFCLVALRAAIAVHRRGRLVDALVAGLSIGAAVVCRPVDAACFAVPAAALFLVPLLRGDGDRRRRLAGVGVAIAAGLPFVALLFAWNHAVTGSFLRSPVQMFAAQTPGSHLFGFGVTPFGLQHTPSLAFSKTLVTWLRVDSWLCGWPLVLVLVPLCVVGLGGDAGAAWLLGVIVIHGVVFFFYGAPSVHTFGSYYQLPLAPLLLALVARALVTLGERLRPFGATAAALPVRATLALGALALFTFWMPEASFIAATADTINLPLQLADEAAKDGPILLFYRGVQPRYGNASWVYWPPQSNDDPSERVLWATDFGAHDAALVRLHPERRPMFLERDPWGGARVVPFTPPPPKPGQRLPTSEELQRAIKRGAAVKNSPD